jgi:hypothetical protein
LSLPNKPSSVSVQQIEYKGLLGSFFASVKSLAGNTCGQMFINDLEFSKFVSMEKESNAGKALSQFFEDVGVPAHIHTKGAKALTLGDWKKVRETQGGIKQTLTELLSPWQNRAEIGIGQHKRQAKRKTALTKTPKALWDYCGVWV